MITIAALIFASPYIYTLGVIKDEKYGIKICIPRQRNHVQKSSNLASSVIEVIRDITTLLVLTTTNIRMSKAIHSSCQILGLGSERSRRSAS